MNKTFNLLLGIFLLIAPRIILAHEGHDHGMPVYVSVALDSKQQLWRASSNNGFVYVDQADLAKLPLVFNSPKKLNAESYKVAVNGEGKPKIVVAKNGNIYVTWTQILPTNYSGYIWFSRSVDGGATFSEPKIIHQDRSIITHAFDALAVAPSGRVFVAWVDKRDLVEAQKLKQAYEGAAIYYAVSEDAGASFSLERKVADTSCECCRIAMIANEKGEAVMMWRHLFDAGVRDHAIVKVNPSEANSKIHRASFGNWKIDACPHHGPAIAKGGDWGYHMAWFDGGDKAGLFYGRMDGEAWVSSPAKRFGDTNQQAGHPALLSDGDQVWLAWKEMTDTTSIVKFVKSNDGGRSWGETSILAESKGKSDYPQLLLKDAEAYLAWNTEVDGLLWMKAAQ